MSVSSKNPLLTIIRGLPGSGKSSLALDYDGFHLSPDDFRYVDGKYKYHANDREPVHLMSVFFLYLVKRKCDIVLDAVFTKRDHYEWYSRTALEAGYNVQILYPTTKWAWDVQECFENGSHNVPLETIQRMSDEFER